MHQMRHKHCNILATATYSQTPLNVITVSRHSSPDNSLLLCCHALALLTLRPAKQTGDQQGLQQHPSAR